MEKEAGFVETVNETIDPTVYERWQKDNTYRPKNLNEWAERTKTDPNTAAIGTFQDPKAETEEDLEMEIPPPKVVS